MKNLLINLLLVGLTLVFVQPNAIREDYSSAMVALLSGKDQEASKAEMTPSPNTVEGDMELSAEQKDVYHAMKNATAENMDRVWLEAKTAFKTWPGKTLVYRFDASLDEVMKQLFLDAVEIYKEHTVVKFEEALDDYSGTTVPMVILAKENGCSSTVGYIGSEGRMNLKSGKCNLGVVVHEIGHALGRFHEHTRSDRDDYVTINEANILGNHISNFQKVYTPLHSPYDLQSIMHYAHNFFATAPGLSTIVPHEKAMIRTMGLQYHMSRLDMYTVNAIYGLDAACPDDLWDKCTRGGVPNKHCTCNCLPEFEGAYCELVVAQTECSGHYQLEGPGLISSPGYPKLYPYNSRCNYIIECATDEVVQLNFPKFYIENEGCGYDRMNIMTGDLILANYPDKYCGDQLQGKQLVSKTNVALMRFWSDDVNNYDGYQIAYACIPPPDVTVPPPDVISK
ncbi:blastula protease 10-like [Asterias amurensis]|uniref:blastula protease 10-like n=1 Tax=Asterias amurensis TaxID=7602 RepID=UPI003AB4B51B